MKAKYIKPETKVVTVALQQPLLAGSGDIQMFSKKYDEDEEGF